MQKSKSNNSAIFEIHFWEVLENEIMLKYPVLNAVINSPERFCEEKIMEFSEISSYGLVFDKLKIIYQTAEHNQTTIKIHRDSSITKPLGGIAVLEETIPFNIGKLKSVKEAEVKAKALVDLI
jgi:hypothetical protein